MPNCDRVALPQHPSAIPVPDPRALFEMTFEHPISTRTRPGGCNQINIRTSDVANVFGSFPGRRERLAAARLYVLIDGRGSQEAFAALARSLVAAGVDVLQLRDKNLDDRPLLGRARLLRELIGEASTLLIVNDRPDLALLAEADGVHVGQEELMVDDVRKVVGPDLLVGVSTHSLAQARQAEHDGADYIGCGPTFPSATKHFERFPGVEFCGPLAETSACRLLPLAG